MLNVDYFKLFWKLEKIRKTHPDIQVMNCPFESQGKVDPRTWFYLLLWFDHFPEKNKQFMLR